MKNKINYTFLKILKQKNPALISDKVEDGDQTSTLIWPNTLPSLIYHEKYLLYIVVYIIFYKLMRYQNKVVEFLFFYLVDIKYRHIIRR